MITTARFRYSGEPVPAMSGMMKQAPVVYIGTFSKTLFPALRIGFVVMPPALAQTIRDSWDRCCAVVTGLNSERWRCLSKGHYARHLAAMRRLYRRRQQQLRGAGSGADRNLCSSRWRGRTAPGGRSH